MTIYAYQGQHLTPGMLPSIETVESEFTSVIWGRNEQQVYGHNAKIAAGTQDTGNTGYVTTLRPGLLLGRTTSLDYGVWNPVATDGTQDIAAVLLFAVAMAYQGSTQPRFTGYILQGGNVKSKGLLIPGNVSAGIVGDLLEYEVRRQMAGRFRFDDDVFNYTGAGSRGIVTKAANYTVVPADYGKAFHATAAVNFTLPVIPRCGWIASFHNLANTDMTVTSGAANDMIVFNDVAATSVALSTAGQKVGGSFTVEGNGTVWIVKPNLWTGQTVTVV